MVVDLAGASSDLGGGSGAGGGGDGGDGGGEGGGGGDGGGLGLGGGEGGGGARTAVIIESFTIELVDNPASSRAFSMSSTDAAL